MSLLMDALRKAEEAKRAAAGDSGAAMHEPETSPSIATTDELSLEPIETSTATAAASTVRAAPRPMPPPVPPSLAAAEAQRQSVQNVFAAKTARTRTPIDKAFAVALAVVAVLGLGGIGIYVWLQMRPHGGVQLAGGPPNPNSVQAAAPLPQTPPAPAAAALPPPAATSTAASVATAAPVSTVAAPPAPPRSATPTAADPISITQHRPRVNPLLEQGYAALERGELSQAQQAYARMLASDPRSLDALYGLAAIAVANKQADLAADYYLRMLEVDPRDPVGQAGLAGLGGRAGSNAESRLKTLLAEQPDAPQLQFALGNVYAQQQRWREAQQAYFIAYKNDSANPDAAFNLAVSLDQLHQAKLAAQYYAEALRLAAAHPAAFERKQAQARLLELQESVRP